MKRFHQNEIEGMQKRERDASNLELLSSRVCLACGIIMLLFMFDIPFFSCLFFSYFYSLLFLFVSISFRSVGLSLSLVPFFSRFLVLQSYFAFFQVLI